MTDELEPIEERMRSQLINMVKEAHERVSYHYRATLGSGADSTPAAARHEQLMEPDINQAQEFGSVSAAVFETFYQPPPVQPHLSSAFQPSIFSNQDKGNEEDDPSTRDILAQPQQQQIRMKRTMLSTILKLPGIAILITSLML